MGNDFALWLLNFAKCGKVEVPRPEIVDIFCIDWANFRSENVADLFKNGQKLANLFVFVASDGPLPTAKVLKLFKEHKASRFPGQCWADKLPDSEALTDKLLTEKSKTMGHTRIIYSHKFVIGEADYKIGEFYCNWARSPQYTSGFSYLVESCDSDVLLVTLGFHEEKCFFVRPEGDCYDVGALRHLICEFMGGGDVRRRVDDFRALATFTKCDFRSGCGRSPEELIEAYKEVTRGKPDFLVDGDDWNVDLLREFFNELAKSEKHEVEFTVDDCRNYFRGLKWLLRLYNGFCPAWDFCPQGNKPSFRALAANMDQFDQTGDFENDIDTILELPPTVLKLTQEVMPQDAPGWVKNSEVFRPMFKLGGGRKIERVATLSEVVEKYKTCLHDKLISEYPDLAKPTRRIPWLYCKGVHSAVNFVRQRPDFESLFRTVPRLGSTVIYQKRGIGRLMGFHDGQCDVELHHFNLDRIKEGVVTAVQVGSVSCDIQDLTWAGGGTPPPLKVDEVVDGEPYICLGSKHFGVVGVRHEDDGMIRLLVSANQVRNPPEGVTKALIPFSMLESVARFEQFTEEELRSFVG